MPCPARFALVRKRVLFNIFNSVVVHEYIEITEETVPAEVELVACDGFDFYGIGEFDELIDSLLGRNILWGSIEKLDRLFRHLDVFGYLSAPKPVDAVPKESFPVEVVRLSNELPVWNTDTGEELPHNSDLWSTARLLEANVVELCPKYEDCQRKEVSIDSFGFTLFIW